MIIITDFIKEVFDEDVGLLTTVNEEGTWYLEHLISIRPASCGGAADWLTLLYAEKSVDSTVLEKYRRHLESREQGQNICCLQQITPYQVKLLQGVPVKSFSVGDEKLLTIYTKKYRMSVGRTK